MKQHNLTRRKIIGFYVFLLFFLGNIGLSVDRYFNRSNTPLNLQDKMEIILQLYSTANRSSSDSITFRLELDVCLRWCSLLWEQNDVKVCHRKFFFSKLILFRNIEMILINISHE